MLYSPISEAEVIEAIRKLKTGKSSGTDNIIAEMFKTAGGIIPHFLTDDFHEGFSNVCCPDSWSTAITVPIFMKADRDSPDNYRRFLLVCVVGTCYTSTLNTRLRSWLQHETKTVETYF